MNTQSRKIWQDLRYLTLFPKRYKGSPPDCPADRDEWRKYWGRVSRKLARFTKEVQSSDQHWRVITYKDGRKELAYIKVRTTFYVGMVNKRGQLCRGLSVFHRAVTPHQFAFIKSIRLAF